ncbi:hypothetical protein OSH11_21510 [Kaistia dalseonensis]|uniref:Uncharacterized protein n=1 Tax=Kaistia dalseonensis TaxID=410840 RepID=A0ABU0HC86_9HYPH|nr:hypothetical protein [Kaistia dalseonensis]MCX5497289.1 hypothetical protein [Kaistia dalseonensis]MDQ0439925.1 hypothetical protein [Kaistia dalseonensis]
MTSIRPRGWRARFSPEQIAWLAAIGICIGTYALIFAIVAWLAGWL